MKQMIADATASTTSDPFQIRDVFGDVPDARKDATFTDANIMVTGDEVFSTFLDIGPTEAGPFEQIAQIGPTPRVGLVKMTARAWYQIRIVDGGQTGTVSVWAG